MINFVKNLFMKVFNIVCQVIKIAIVTVMVILADIYYMPKDIKNAIKEG